LPAWQVGKFCSVLFMLIIASVLQPNIPTTWTVTHLRDDSN